MEEFGNLRLHTVHRMGKDTFVELPKNFGL